MPELQTLFRQIGSFRYDPAAMSVLTGVDVRTIEAHYRLGNLMVRDGLVIGVHGFDPVRAAA